MRNITCIYLLWSQKRFVAVWLTLQNAFDVSYLQKKHHIDIEFLQHQTFVGELATLNPTVEHIMRCTLAIWKKSDVILQYKDVAIEVKTADKGVFSCQMVEVLP